MRRRTDVKVVEEEWDCSTLKVQAQSSTDGTMYRSTRRNISGDLALPRRMKTSNLAPMNFVSLRFLIDMKKCKIKNWKEESKNRVYREKSSKEAKVRFGL
jgi:hypothetical protein